VKIVISFLAALLLVGSFSAANARAAAEAVISSTTAEDVNQVLTADYCHLKFPAIREETLAGNRPTLKETSSGDIIDFHGRCDTDPLGQNQIQAQRGQKRGRVAQGSYS
jgi:hypothetical protein